MNKLERLIQELCPDGVEYKALEECCNVLDRKRKPITKSARVAGEYPYYGANGIQDYVADYIFDGVFVLVGEDGSVITPEGTPVVNWAEGKIWVNNHAHIIEKKEGVLLRYLYHYIQTINVSHLIHGNIPKLTGGDFKDLQVPVPPIEVQREIVRILDSFTKLTADIVAELTTERTARQKQYDYYREQLINDAEGTFGKLIDLLSQPITDGPHTTPKLVSEGIPFVSATAIWDGKVHFEKAQGFITKEADVEYSRKYKPKRNDVFMVKSGSTTGKVAIVDTDENFNIWSPLAAMRTDNEITARYIYHLLQTASVQNMVLTRMSHGSQPNLSMRVLEQFDVKIPTTQEQERIVELLDRFDAVCNDISAGLPAEIEARQKQYEYYRDKLLTFKELSV